MTTITRLRGRTSLALSLIAALALAVPVQRARADSNPNPGVLPPGSTPYGLTYAQWSARWMQWAYSIPGPVNPMLDTTGAQCAQGQSGKVWFLAGVLGASGAVTRSCTVPSGKALFFPVVNNWCDTVPPGPVPPDACRVTYVIPFMQGIADQEADVDGVQIQGLQTSGCPQVSPSGDAFVQAQPSYCVGSPAFTFTLPDNNFYAYLLAGNPDICPAGQPCAPPGTYVSVTAGIYLMLAPLSVGTHTIHFHAYSAPGMDVTYKLTVAP
jgi:hypothetical protein